MCHNVACEGVVWKELCLCVPVKERVEELYVKVLWRPRTQPSAVSATPPATENYHQRRQVPYLPRQASINVTKCHACHTK